MSTPPAPTVKPPAATDMIESIKSIMLEERDMKVKGVADLKVRMDTRGRWWAAGTAIPARTDRFDRVRVVITLDSGEWVLFKYDEKIDPEDLPADVRGIL